MHKALEILSECYQDEKDKVVNHALRHPIHGDKL